MLGGGGGWGSRIRNARVVNRLHDALISFETVLPFLRPIDPEKKTETDLVRHGVGHNPKK